MVRTVEATVSQTRRVNLGNYENINLFLSIRLEFETEDQGKYDDLMKEAFKQARRVINSRVAIIEGKVKED